MSSTGSFINNIMGGQGQAQPTAPEVGMGATRLCWTDRIAGTIIEVHKNKAGKVVELAFQEDRAERTDKYGMSDCQSYSYEAWPEGPVSRYTLRKDGSWVRMGSAIRNGERLAIGIRKHYHDYSF